MKTSELTGAALDWAVAKCEGAVSDDIDDFCLSVAGEYAYSTDWAQGGPIIEREGISCSHLGGPKNIWVGALLPVGENDTDWDWRFNKTGSTPLIAAMRCYVASKLGDEVEVPEELK